MSSPLIGITTFRSASSSGILLSSLSEAYSQALINAGACPLLIPSILPGSSLDALVQTLDGVLFSGGGDVHPEFYNSQMHPLVSEIETDRDRLEIRLVKQAVQSNLPFLGICRGLQVINVAMGGSLYEDILDQRPGSQQHQFSQSYPRDFPAHPVLIQPDACLAEILSATSLLVNSLHHQGIKDLAPGLRAAAYAPDGLMEAIELENHPFGLAVQWHPECMQGDPSMRALFQAFVEAAGRSR